MDDYRREREAADLYGPVASIVLGGVTLCLLLFDGVVAAATGLVGGVALVVFGAVLAREKARE
jgi:hypothetical protein